MVDEIGPRYSDPVVDLHLAYLISEAKVRARERPWERVVGIVADAKTPEEMFLVQSEENISRAHDGSVSALIPREVAKEHLRDASPGMLDWLDDEGDGPRRKLSTIHAAKLGLRMVITPYDLADELP
jgi:hypothetical protein